MDYVYRLLMSESDLDDKFLEDAFDMMMDKERNGLDDFAKAVFVSDEDSENLGDYDVDTQLITVYLKNILKEQEIPLYRKKILALEVLRHELEHARNVLKIHQCHNDIESVVLRASLKKYAMDQGIDISRTLDKVDPITYYFNKKENYDVDPDERLAEIRGWKYIVNLIKNQRNSPELMMARNLLYKSYIKGYKSNRYYLEAPTYQYLINTHLSHQFYLLRKRVAEHDYCLETRLRCGLPIRQRECDYDTKRLALVQKKRRTL